MMRADEPKPGELLNPIAGADLKVGQLVEYHDGKVYPMGLGPRPLPPAVKPAWVAPGSWLAWVVLGLFVLGVPLALMVLAVYHWWRGA